MPNYITLPRPKLYDLVWSKPVRDVARDFGISDVALAKRCRALRIPLPPRGYWARVAAGQTPKRPRLPGFRDPRAQPSRGAASQRERPHQPGGAASPSLPSYASASAGEEPVISFAPLPEPKPDTPLISPAEASLRAHIDALATEPLDTLVNAHAAVLRTAVRLKRLRSGDIVWPRGTRSGPIIEVRNVSDAQQDRALKVLATLLRGADQLDWSFEVPPPDLNADRRQSLARSTYRPPVYGRLIVDGEPLQLRIDERQRQSDHVPTETEKADKKRGRHVWMPRFDYAPSGELRLHVTEPGHSYTEKVWKDTRAHPLEVQVRKILHGLLNLALERKRHREEQRQREIEARELERQQAIVRERRAANTQLIHELERQAGAWHRAQFLRRYVRAAKRTLGADSITLDLNGQPTNRDAAQSCSAADRPAHQYAGKDAVDETSSLVGKSPASFLAWAEHYIDQLDPLSATDHDSDMTPERSCYSDSDRDRLQGELRRLSGHTWDRASRVVTTLTEDTDSPDSADDADQDDDHWNDDD